MDIWFKKIGFHNNPFSIKPAAFHDELISYDLEYVYGKISDGEMIFIDGQYGTGKTTILKNIINRFRGQKKVVYYNFNRHDEFNIVKLVNGANSSINKVIGIFPKNLIVLLDEVEKINQADGNKLLDFYDEGIIKSIIFVNNDYYASKLPKDLEERLNGNIIRTRELSLNDAIKLIRKRIGNIDLLTDSIIKTIFRRANSNPRKFLEYAEDICRFAVDIEDYTVTEFHIEKVLGKEDITTKKKVTKKKVAKKVKPVVVKKNVKPKAKKVAKKKTGTKGEKTEKKKETLNEVKENVVIEKETIEPKVESVSEEKVIEKFETIKNQKSDDKSAESEDEFSFLKDEIEVINLDDVEELSIDKKTKVKPKAKKSENIEETVEEYQVAVYDIFDEE